MATKLLRLDMKGAPLVIFIVALILLSSFMLYAFYTILIPYKQVMLKNTILRDITYRTVDNIALKMDFYFPNATDSKPYPVVVYVHGGGWSKGSKDAGVGFIDFPALRANGYLVVSIDYRLAPTYKFPTYIEDVKCAIRYLRENADKYSIDTAHIGALGDSAGGHLVALLGLCGKDLGWDVGQYLDQSSEVQAVVDYYGPTNLTKYSTNIDIFREAFGSTEALRAASPIAYVSKNCPPFLIVQGNKDFTVYKEQSVELYNKLTSVGAQPALVIVENADHGFRPFGGEINPSREEITRIVVEFFNKHLK
jgi:acetyl esterase/lipase